MGFFKNIKDRIKKFFIKNKKDDETLELKDFNINIGEEVIGYNDGYIPSFDYIGKEFPIEMKPNNRINPKRRYITLQEAEKLIRK